jgi:hypothetical protein
LSPIVATGYLDAISIHSVESVSVNVVGAPHRIERIYWCAGKFHSQLAIRGRIEHSMYRWASTTPDCSIRYRATEDDARNAVVMWFMREEAGFLRPLSDGARFSLHINVRQIIESDPRRRIGEALWNDVGKVADPKEKLSEILDVADIVCGMLGEPECVKRMLRLAKELPPDESSSLCRYLKDEWKATCGDP